MDYFLGFLGFILIVALIIGLVKPALVLRWRNNPNRIEVLGYWVIASMAMGIMGLIGDAIFEEKNDIEKKTNTEEKIDIGKKTNTEEKTSADNIKKENFIQDYINQEVNNEETTRLKKSIEQEINSINNGIDFSKYHNSRESLKWELILFNAWALHIKDGENSQDL